MLIVVYGTLKKNYGNNGFLKGKTLISEVTVPNFKLFNCGFPVATPSEGESIVGELWDIGDDASCLARLDALEGNGRMYIRTPIVALAEGKEIDAEMYVGGSSYWGFEKSETNRSGGLTICPKNEDGHYVWGR